MKILKIALGIITIIGFYWLFKILYLDTPKVEGSPLNPSRIATQTFKIKADKDTILTTSSGSLLFINKSSFINSNGQLIDGEIEIKYKEILTKKDIILSGLSTISNGRLLESGGMINVRAFHDGQEIFLGDSSKMRFAIESEKIEPDMQLFKGLPLKEFINWTDPEPLLNDTVVVVITRYPWNQDEFTREEAIKLGILFVDTLTGDRIFADYDEIISDAPELDLAKINRKVEDDYFADNPNSILNYNKQSIQDKYVFELFDLGWANIDKFYNDEQSAPVDLKVNVSNQNDYGKVYVSLCLKSRNIQIGAYQYHDKIFRLNPIGKVSPKLPIGEDVFILASAIKKGKMYLDIKSVQIQETQSIFMTLKPFNQEQLEKMIGDLI